MKNKKLIIIISSIVGAIVLSIVIGMVATTIWRSKPRHYVSVGYSTNEDVNSLSYSSGRIHKESKLKEINRILKTGKEVQLEQSPSGKLVHLSTEYGTYMDATTKGHTTIWYLADDTAIFQHNNGKYFAIDKEETSKLSKIAPKVVQNNK